MDRQTLDQTASEVHLHRVLWLIKLLRAMVLHVPSSSCPLAFFLARSAGVAPPGFEFQSRPIGFFFQSGGMVEIVNNNRTATPYRTAFSYFWQSRSTRSDFRSPCIAGGIALLSHRTPSLFSGSPHVVARRRRK